VPGDPVKKRSKDATSKGVFMHEKFIARQPIFDTRLRVYAYELLFRGGPQNFFQPYISASASVIADSITLFDLQMLTGDARAFVNVDELALRLGAARLLPVDRIVIEILETVKPTEGNIQHCRELRAAGYQLALDDFMDEPAMAPMVEMAQFLKIDFQQLDAYGRESIAKKYRDTGVSLLAEKVETLAELDEARRLGFGYFQGYFFCKPSMLETRDIPGSNRVHLQLLSAVAAERIDYDEIDQLTKLDPSLLYRLLRYLNSPMLGLRSEVNSVSQAVSLLGEQEFRRWISVFAVIALSSGKPPELVRTALTRAYFCEELADVAGMPAGRANLFLLGLLSIADALFDKPMEEVLATLPMKAEVKKALLGGANQYRNVYNLLLAFERAEWRKLSECAGWLCCEEESIPDFYQSALKKAAAIGV
jgi:EAL and modified HD-GYP domain-containing signal transduction protein